MTNGVRPDFLLRLARRMRARTDMFWRLAMRMRTRSWVLPKPGLLSALSALRQAFGGRGARLEAKIDRLSAQTEFLQRRIGTYLGDGIAITFLPDETPIFINANDYGGPMNLLVGGEYEQANLTVLLSYVNPRSTVVDIGANLGFFSLKLARRLRAPGRVLAFEPHPFLVDLMSRTIYLNGLRDMVTVHAFGLSDREGPAEFQYPAGHLGGGYVAADTTPAGVASVASSVRPLDAVLPAGTVVDLVKIDVEGHELPVLRGMRRTLETSPGLVVLFEKLVPHAGYESAIYELLSSLGMRLYAVDAHATLRELSLDAFSEFGGYVLAGRTEAVGQADRARFSIYPEQLRIPLVANASQSGTGGVVRGTSGTILFHGPYWPLERGFWECRVNGQISGRVTVTIAERWGRPVVEFALGPAIAQAFYVDHDLVNFECIVRASGGEASIAFQTLEFRRVSERAMFEAWTGAAPERVS